MKRAQLLVSAAPAVFSIGLGAIDISNAIKPIIEARYSGHRFFRPVLVTADPKGDPRFPLWDD